MFKRGDIVIRRLASAPIGSIFLGTEWEVVKWVSEFRVLIASTVTNDVFYRGEEFEVVADFFKLKSPVHLIWLTQEEVSLWKKETLLS